MDINIINTRIVELRKQGQVLLDRKKFHLETLQRVEAELLGVLGAIEELTKLVQNKGEEKKDDASK